MSKSPLRYKRLIKILPKHKNAQDALIEAGFAKSTARKQARRVMASALKHEARQVLENAALTVTPVRKLMSDIIGLSSETLFERLRFIAIEQNKDYGTALKVLSALVKEHGVVLQSEEQKTVVPQLNITVKEAVGQDALQEEKNMAITGEAVEHPVVRPALHDVPQRGTGEEKPLDNQGVAWLVER